MSEMRNLLVDSAARLFARLGTPEAFAAAERQELPAVLWDALEGSGLTQATRNAARGGEGSDLHVRVSQVAWVRVQSKESRVGF